MKIEKINLLHLRNDAQFQFHTEFRDLVAKQGAAALKIKSQFDDYLPLYDRVERVNALAVVEGVAGYETFIRTMNAVVAKYAVKHHRHRLNQDSQNSQDSQNVPPFKMEIA